jgi:hypothetical protein
MSRIDDAKLTDEVSDIAARLTVAAKSWAQPDALDHRDPEAETELLMDVMNELNARRLRIAELEASMRHAAKIEDALRGIIHHWNEFGEMMGVKDDYGFSERLDAAEKLIR